MGVPDVPGPGFGQGVLGPFHVDERRRFPNRATNDPDTYPDPAGRHRPFSLVGSARTPDSRTHRGSQFLIYENAAHGLPFTRTDRMLANIVAFAGPWGSRDREVSLSSREVVCGRICSERFISFSPCSSQ
jgi:hypothetical protein